MVHNLENEVWLPVSGYENNYRISNMGRIKSLKPSGEKILALAKDKDGYLLGCLSKNGVATTFRVHRLVGQHFIPNPENKPEINHKKGLKWDNRATELEWNTTSENITHSFRELGKVSAYKGRKGILAVNSKKVKCDTFDILFNSTQEAGQAVGIHPARVAQICRNKRKPSEGITFRYI